MPLLNPPPKQNGVAFLERGFRPFFFGATVIAMISMLLWALHYHFGLVLPFESLSSTQWHAHEMIFGYSSAVIAGFLLTAVTNWTGQPTAQGKFLLFIFASWLIARVLFFLGTEFFYIAAFFDILFSILLLKAIITPIIFVKQWKQIGILVKVSLLLFFNLVFYLGVYLVPEGSSMGTSIFDGYNLVSIGLYGGLYIIIALILTMGRRIIPFFIQNGVDSKFIAKNYAWLDYSSLVLVLLFFVIEVFFSFPVISGSLALAIFMVNSIRLTGWYTHEIWKKPLLWSLYLAFAWISLGFLMFAMAVFYGLSMFIMVHALAVGTIALLTLSMVFRVSMGHSGRNVNSPSSRMKLALFLLLLTALIRTLGLLMLPQFYTIWIGLSQVLWIAVFFIASLELWPIVTKPSVR